MLFFSGGSHYFLYLKDGNISIIRINFVMVNYSAVKVIEVIHV